MDHGKRIAGLVCLGLFLALVLGRPAHADFEAVKEYRFQACSGEAIRGFLAVIRREKAEAAAQLGKKYPGDPDKVARNPVTVAFQLLETSAADLARREAAGEPPSRLAAAFDRLQRLHYSTRAQLDPYADPPLLVLGWKCGSNFLFGPFKLTTRSRAPDKPLGEAHARLEASRLRRPGSETPVSLEDLAKMSPDEVSRLEPRNDHPALRPVAPGNHYAAFLAGITRLIRRAGKKTERFDLAYARRILFFDELKTDASSPKVKAKDRYGVGWRVKWGDEVHADVVATRLAIELGATYADLKFWSGPGETLLILPPAKNPGDPATQADLERLLLDSKFAFHLRRYMVGKPSLSDGQGNPIGTGKVDAAMLERESLDPKYLGCVYLAFKECQLSLDSPAIKRLGGVDLNRGAALDDRVARGSLVFSTWINNPDVKEDNTCGGLLLDEQTGAFTRYVEFLSDMGASFAGPFSAGCLSTLSANCVGEVLDVQSLQLHPVFLPDCWRHCTWADARWMARRIGHLRRADLERVFADSGWPVFSQKLGVEKLLARRNDLVKTFDLEREGIPLEPCDPRLTIKITTAAGPDYPVIKGLINPRSRLVQEAERAAHPEGLLLTRPRQLD